MAWRGQLSKNLKELRILLCQSSPSSSSTRAFVEKNYRDLKAFNPKLPILMRECGGIQPQLWIRYGGVDEMTLPPFVYKTDVCLKNMGVEKGIRLEDPNEDQIFEVLEELAFESGSSDQILMFAVQLCKME